jgi:hypothetical protein
VLVDETDWAPDIDRLVATAAGAELLRRVAIDAGERKPLSDLHGPALEHGDASGEQP